MHAPKQRELVAPGIDPKYPAAHAPLHRGEPRVEAEPYSPAEQGAQELAPVRLYVPIPHATAVGESLLFNGHAYPAVQFEHDTQPAQLYCPNTQATAVLLTLPLDGHTYPALQLLHDNQPDKLY